MKKLFLSIVLTFCLIIGSSVTASAKENIVSVALVAQDNFKMSYDLVNKTLDFSGVSIVATLENGTQQIISHHTRSEAIYAAGYAIVDIYNTSGFNFRITFAVADDSITAVNVKSKKGELVRYDYATEEQTLLADALNAEFTYNNNSTGNSSFNHATDDNTAITEDGAFYLTLDNVLICKNNFTPEDRSIFDIIIFKSNTVPEIKNTPTCTHRAFTMWYDDSSMSTVYDEKAPLENSKVIYAGWRTTLHTLSVVNGSGSGTYYAGDAVTIKCDSYIGKLFTYWLCNDNNIRFNKNSAELTFTMPDNDLTFSAQYEACKHKDIIWQSDDVEHTGICPCGVKIIAEHDFSCEQADNEAIYTCKDCGYSYRYSEPSDVVDILPMPRSIIATDTDAPYDDTSANDIRHAQKTSTGDEETALRYIIFMFLSAAILIICKRDIRATHKCR